MDMNEQQRRASVSDLVDGRLRGQGFADAVTALSADADARASWHAYHLIGDVLRSGELAGGARDQAFVRRLSARLQAESVARPVPVAVPAPKELMPAVVSVRQAANAPQVQQGRWRMLALAASVAAVAAIGWNVLGTSVVAPNQPQMAALPAAAPVPGTPATTTTVQVGAVTGAPAAIAGSEPQPVMLRDPRLDELLAAHKQAGGASALQMPAGFLRNATFEGQAR